MSLPNTESEASRPGKYRTYIGGVIVFDGYSFECVVRNISSGGAKIELPESQYVADKLFLIDLKHALAFEAVVMWRAYPMVGVRFVDREDLSEPASPKFKFLRHIWLGKRELG